MDADERRWMQIASSAGGAAANSPRREPWVAGRSIISPDRGGRGSFAPGGAWANWQDHPGLTAGATVYWPSGPAGTRNLVKLGPPIGMCSHRAISALFHASRRRRRVSTRRVPVRGAGRYLANCFGRKPSTICRRKL